MTRSTASDASPGPGPVLLTTKQQHRLAKVFTDERHVAFEVTWSLYQSVIEAYQADQPAEGKKIMTRLITSIQSGVPAGLEELRSLGQTMKQHRGILIVNYIARCLLNAGELRPLTHSLL